jgi:hypothetical protein
MSIKTKNVDVHLNPEYGNNCLNFVFKGKFTVEASIAASTEWRREFKASSGQNFLIIWDCMEMDGFDMAAKREWFNCMNELHDQIDKIIVISDNMVVRGAAYLMLKSFNIESEVFKTYPPKNSPLSLNSIKAKALAF